MKNWSRSRWRLGAGLGAVAVALLAGAARAEDRASPSEVEGLRTRVEDLERRLLEQDRLIRELLARPVPVTPPAPPSGGQAELEAELARELGTPASGAKATAGATAATGVTGATGTAPSAPGAITVAGGGSKLINLSLDGLFAAGTASTPEVERLESGGHDPSQRGFTVQNLEMVLDGAVDPYFRGQANLVYQIDRHGETVVELEEAYVTTTALPYRLQLKGGAYFSEFGRLNSQHPHAWDFIDQPLASGRFLGPDGLRGPGARLSWLLPTGFYSELFLSVQDSQGETAASFRGVPGESVYGRPLLERPVRGLDDLLLVPRYAASFDLTGNQTLLLGLSGAFGPNGTGADTRTRIGGLDAFWKWKPANSQAGFPFVKAQGEVMARSYEAGAATVEDGAETELLAETISDWGGYGQVLWGFRRGFVLGLRGDYLAGADPGAPGDEGLGRVRVSPGLTWYPTEFSKLRLQYNHDHRQGLESDDAVWLQLEFMIGAHGAHKF